MKQNFEETYEKICNSCPKDVVNNSLRIYDKKKRFNKIGIIVLLVVAIVLICFIVLESTGSNYDQFDFMTDSQFFVFFLIFFVVASAIISKLLFSKDDKYVEYNYNKYVANPLINSVLPDEKYLPNAGVTETIYNPRIYNTNYDRYYSYNLISSEKEHLIFSMVHTEVESKDSDGHTTYSTNFLGIAGKKTLDKNIQSTFSVLRNGAAFLSSSRVKADSSSFEKYFDIKADNKIMVMRFLTSDIMEKILDLKINYNYNFEFGIVNDTLYFRISIGKPFLSSDKELLNKDNMYNTYSILNEILYFSNFIDSVTDDLEV